MNWCFAHSSIFVSYIKHNCFNCCFLLQKIELHGSTCSFFLAITKKIDREVLQNKQSPHSFTTSDDTTSWQTDARGLHQVASSTRRWNHDEFVSQRTFLVTFKYQLTHTHLHVCICMFVGAVMTVCLRSLFSNNVVLGSVSVWYSGKCFYCELKACE